MTKPDWQWIEIEVLPGAAGKHKLHLLSPDEYAAVGEVVKWAGFLTSAVPGSPEFIQAHNNLTEALANLDKEPGK